MLRIPPDVATKVGYYVYIYCDPRTGRPFYVGKGRGNRMMDHLDPVGRSKKAKRIRSIQASRIQPRIEILAHGMRSAEVALRVEAAAIDLLGLAKLTNEVRGYKSLVMGRMSIDELVAHYRAKPTKIKHRVILIRVSRQRGANLSDQALYENTRGVWVLSRKRASKAEYAFSVYAGVVCEVYKITSWHPGGTTPYKTRSKDEVDDPGRLEFRGVVASNQIRSQYLHRSVSRYLPKGAQNPIRYVNL